MKIAAGSTLLFIGDSITDAGRTRPVGDDSGENLGTGYVNMVGSLLRAACPERRIRVLNTGISGDTARHLKGRWQTDVLGLKPDWLAVMIGINDVWRQFDRPLATSIHVGLDEYRHTLDELIAEAAPGLKGLVLMTPYYIEPNRKEPMRAMMDRYGAIVKKLADKHSALCVDTQAAFDGVLEHMHPAVLAGDRVHPFRAGHMILARAFLKTIDFPW